MAKLIVTKVVTVEEEITLPVWMQEALQGYKIKAIKELRYMAGGDGDHNLLTWYHAKIIVENFIYTAGI